MSDYISRDSITEWRPKNIEIFNSRAYIDLEELLALVDGIPAADVEPVRRWIPCSERLPESTDRVLVAITACKYPGITPELDTDRCVKGNWVRWGDNVTHWQPLPEPPEEGGARNARDD